MLGRIFGTVAVCVLSASALILPPGVSPAVNGEAPGFSVATVDPKNQVFRLAYPGSLPPTYETPLDFLLKFSISEDGQQLQLNGEPFYPVTFSQDGEVDGHKFEVELVEDDNDKLVGALPVSAYRLEVFGEQALTPSGDVIVPVQFSIISLGDHLIDTDEVEVKLLKTGDGELLIMDVFAHPSHNGMFEKLPFPPPPHPDLEGTPEDEDFPPPRPHHRRPHGHKHKECSVLPTPLCRLKNMLENKIDHAMGSGHRNKSSRPCPGRKSHGNKVQGHIKPHLDENDRPEYHHGRLGQDEAEGRPKHHHGRPHHGKPHGYHHHGHHGHFGPHFFRAFAKGLVAVLIPVMAGVAVGMTVSLLGLLVGRLVSFLWIKIARGGRRGCASVAQEEAVIVVDEDKAMLAEMEDPPVYEDAPPYEQVHKDENA